MLESLKELFLTATSSLYSKVHDYWTNPNLFDSTIVDVVKWNGSDNEANYLAHGNKKYSKTDITYEETLYGFRSSSTEIFNDKLSTIACFGCSNTVGVGLPWEETWPYLLKQKLNSKYNVKNYGQGGGSCDLISRLVYNYLLTNKPKIICCLLPSINRSEIFLYNKSIRYGPWAKKEHGEKFGDTENNWFNNFFKNVAFLKSMCSLNGIPLYILTVDTTILIYSQTRPFVIDKKTSAEVLKTLTSSLNEKSERARDGLHYGTKIQDYFASYFSDKILTESNDNIWN